MDEAMLAALHSCAPRKAAVIAAVLVTPSRYTPSWTTVCAICGQVPLTMQAAPIVVIISGSGKREKTGGAGRWEHRTHCIEEKLAALATKFRQAGEGTG